MVKGGKYEKVEMMEKAGMWKTRKGEGGKGGQERKTKKGWKKEHRK